MDLNEILKLRRRHIGSSLRLAYETPLHIVKGSGQYLYDNEGRAYLDCVNNVCHVGHSHPRVVEALGRQAAALNTNTRYAHANLVRYAQRLAATFPDPLEVCYFVCSGSEANDLALRLARAYTGYHDVVVVGGAYHGTTEALVQLSPYKYAGPGGKGPGPFVHEAATPDAYRDGLPNDDPGAGVRYVEQLTEVVAHARAAGRQIAAFFCESILSCAGQIVLPPGYLRGTYAAVHDEKGVCVADEVQTGFGRVGSHFWAFETQGVVPDIVTLGKPIGNGHPLGAVVTTRAIADAFDNGMEYFNTFGGNPVSCAVGLAVLEVIEEEGLQAHAHDVGTYLETGLQSIAHAHPVIGDVRGLGLFLGVELVRDRETRDPAGTTAKWVVERMRERKILLSTDGPHHNVIKIKPPLPFTRANADQLVNELDTVLTNLPNGH